MAKVVGSTCINVPLMPISEEAKVNSANTILEQVKILGLLNE